MLAVCTLVDPSWPSFATDVARALALIIVGVVIYALVKMHRTQLNENSKSLIVPVPLIIFTISCATIFLVSTAVLLATGCTTELNTPIRLVYLGSSTWTMGGLTAIIWSGVKFHERALSTAQSLPESVKEELIKTVIDQELAACTTGEHEAVTSYEDESADTEREK